MNKPLTILFCALGHLTILAAPTVQAAPPKIWHVKAFHPEGRLLDIKALDQQGKPIDIKALQTEGNTHLLDIKAIWGGKEIAVKVLPKPAGEKYLPVKAITDDGTIFAIKALTSDGTKLDVKGVTETGNVISIKAIAPDGTLYGIKAISPEGRVFDVKGIKTSGTEIEGKVGTVEFAAHVKALPQAP